MAFVVNIGALSLPDLGYGPFFTGLAVLAAPVGKIPIKDEFLLLAIKEGALVDQYVYQRGKLVNLAGNPIANGEGYRLGFVAGPINALLHDADLKSLELRVLNRMIEMKGNIPISQLFNLSEPIPIIPEPIEPDVDNRVTYQGEFVTFQGGDVTYAGEDQ